MSRVALEAKVATENLFSIPKRGGSVVHNYCCKQSSIKEECRKFLHECFAVASSVSVISDSFSNSTELLNATITIR